MWGRFKNWRCFSFFVILKILNSFSGFILYFYYGIKNSSLEAETRAQEAEMAEATEGMAVPVPGLCQSPQPPVHHYAEVDPSMPTRTSGDLFIAPQAFPSWDD